MDKISSTDVFFPIFIQSMFDKVCKENYENNSTLKEVMLKVMQETGLEKVMKPSWLSDFSEEKEIGDCRDKPEDYLYTVTTALLYANFAGVFFIENKIAIEDYYKKNEFTLYKSITERMISYTDSNKKINKIKYIIFLPRLRNALAHNNYILYPNSTMRLYNQKSVEIVAEYETKEDIERLMRENKNCSIKKCKKGKLTLVNFNKHSDENTFDATIHNSVLYDVAGGMMQLIYNYIAGTQKR